jgi:hypothetical protein
MNATLAFADFLRKQAKSGLSQAATAAAAKLFCDGVSVAALGAAEAAPRLLCEQASEASG